MCKEGGVFELLSGELRIPAGDMELSHLNRHTEYTIRCMSNRELDVILSNSGLKLRGKVFKSLNSLKVIKLEEH